MDGLFGKEDLFALTENGERDMIHLNDIGAYLVALTHYAVLYHRSPVGLPHQLRLADGRSPTLPARTRHALCRRWSGSCHELP